MNDSSQAKSTSKSNKKKQDKCGFNTYSRN
jgi:hypothetical protein